MNFFEGICLMCHNNDKGINTFSCSQPLCDYSRRNLIQESIQADIWSYRLYQWRRLQQCLQDARIPGNHISSLMCFLHTFWYCLMLNYVMWFMQSNCVPTGQCSGWLSENCSCSPPTSGLLQYQWQGLSRHGCPVWQLLGGHEQSTYPMGVWDFGKIFHTWYYVF